jgi:hypothetical protein
LLENASGILQPSLGIIIEFVTKKAKWAASLWIFKKVVSLHPK